MTDHYTGWRKSRHSNPDGHCVEVATSWRKSRHSEPNGDCVEVAADWRKSRHSEPDGECVEAARVVAGTIGVRDSKLREDSPILEFSRAEWAAFLVRVRGSVA
ncbi:DUF397 domain-containing protein [Actinomadura sp. NTSP31]|uniref:DUF397 domain-containing protein n=1 Tax=Actinomadura sp. NTSP31 TaxID=1735447 RepID=UPI0035C22EA6